MDERTHHPLINSLQIVRVTRRAPRGIILLDDLQRLEPERRRIPNRPFHSSGVAVGRGIGRGLIRLELRREYR